MLLIKGTCWTHDSETILIKTFGGGSQTYQKIMFLIHQTVFYFAMKICAWLNLQRFITFDWIVLQTNGQHSWASFWIFRYTSLAHFCITYGHMDNVIQKQFKCYFHVPPDYQKTRFYSLNLHRWSCFCPHHPDPCDMGHVMTKCLRLLQARKKCAGLLTKRHQGLFPAKLKDPTEPVCTNIQCKSDEMAVTQARGWKAGVETGGQLLPNSIGGSHVAEAGGAQRWAGGLEEHLLVGDQSRRRRSRSPALGTSWRASATISTYHFTHPIIIFIFSIDSCTQPALGAGHELTCFVEHNFISPLSPQW